MLKCKEKQKWFKENVTSDHLYYLIKDFWRELLYKYNDIT